MFGFGLLGSFVLFSGSGMERFRTFIHETKHALAAIFSGSTLKKFRVGPGEGEVEYEIPETQSHYIPIIDLAPYCMPLLTFPTVVFAVIFQNEFAPWLPLAVGTAVGSDLGLCWTEIHHRQSDFKIIAGGFIAAALYIGGAMFLWTSATVLWVIGGRSAFGYAGILGLKIVKMLIDRFQ